MKHISPYMARTLYIALAAIIPLSSQGASAEVALATPLPVRNEHVPWLDYVQHNVPHAKPLLGAAILVGCIFGCTWGLQKGYRYVRPAANKPKNSEEANTERVHSPVQADKYTAPSHSKIWAHTKLDPYDKNSPSCLEGACFVTSAMVASLYEAPVSSCQELIPSGWTDVALLAGSFAASVVINKACTYMPNVTFSEIKLEGEQQEKMVPTITWNNVGWAAFGGGLLGALRKPLWQATTATVVPALSFMNDNPFKSLLLIAGGFAWYARRAAAKK